LALLSFLSENTNPQIRPQSKRRWKESSGQVQEPAPTDPAASRKPRSVPMMTSETWTVGQLSVVRNDQVARVLSIATCEQTHCSRAAVHDPRGAETRE